ncbi:hypothetical protein HQ865_14625 [Mucilaginibacter mali]|uniref:Uncharacterized protein n=1 Tax=Mucilaginibacter mali TaxID=2740462 RepID=A0A7D4Q8U1_9SPHI|nr:hypothetical protein [Mucilaginibacter mali]QKJ30931.1 hypothetical protein HQ865_14625 [Mucilaginibacter mali]
MKADNKHYRFINSETGNTLYYYALDGILDEGQIKAELDKIKAQVAIQNSLYVDIIYWEEMREDAFA